MEDRVIAAELASLASQIEALRTALRGHYHAPLEQKYDALKSATDELKTQLAILLGNINGICERLDRLEQAHSDLVLQYHQGIAGRVEQLERHVVNMLTHTLPSITDRITQLEHQVKDYVQADSALDP